MLSKIRQSNYNARLFIVLATFIALVIFVVHIYGSITHANANYTSLQATAYGMRTDLNNGTSPNGVLTVHFGNWKPQSFSDLSDDKNFAIIKEATSPYIIGTLMVNGQVPSPPKSFLASATVNKTGSMLWRPSFGVHTYIQAYTYHYGNVFGYVMVGKSAWPSEIKILAWSAVGLAVWLAIVVIILPKPKKPAKSSKKSK